MKQITLGDLYSWATFVIGLVGSIVTIIAGVKKAVGKLLESLAMDNAKNYIVPFLARMERGEPVDSIEVERFHEEYKYYRDHNGNSYIKSRVEKLQKGGKL